MWNIYVYIYISICTCIHACVVMLMTPPEEGQHNSSFNKTTHVGLMKSHHVFIYRIWCMSSAWKEFRYVLKIIKHMVAFCMCCAIKFGDFWWGKKTRGPCVPRRPDAMTLVKHELVESQGVQCAWLCRLSGRDHIKPLRAHELQWYPPWN